MSGCEMYQELISCLLDGELNEEESTALAEHLEHCPECEAMFETFTGLSKSISENMEEVPEGLHENIMAAVRREDIKNKNSKKKLSKPVKAILTTAACVALVVGVGVAAAPKFFSSGKAAPQLAMVANDGVEEEMPYDSAPAEAAAPPTQVQRPSENLRDVPQQAPAQFSLRQSAEGGNTQSVTENEMEQTDSNVIALSGENWQRMETFLNERESEAEIPLPETPDYIITLNDDNSCLNVYFIEDSLYYETGEGQVYSVACNAEEFANFLGSLE